MAPLRLHSSEPIEASSDFGGGVDPEHIYASSFQENFRSGELIMAQTKMVALVTGGSRGIGRAICTRLAADGFAVAVNYAANSTAADEVVAAISAKGGAGSR